MNYNVQLTISLWWALPTLTTVASLGWVHWMNKDNHGPWAGVGVALCLGPALFVDTVAWIIGAICK